MTTLLVTGASGHLGRLVVEDLIARGIAPSDIVATARTVSDLDDLAARGVVVRRADYTDPASLDEAFSGVDRAVLVSSSAVGERIEQHRNVIAAAAKAQVELLAYTSILGAGSTTMLLAADHVATEQALAESGVPHVLLRNGWYIENYLDQLPTALEHGALIGSAGEGPISGATRADYASAAAAVLAGGDHAGQAYELGGDQSFTLADVAAEAAQASGRPVAYQDLPQDQHVAALVGVGVPEGFAQVLADCDQGIKRGELATGSGDLARLIGRPTTPLAEAVRAAVA